VKVTDLVTEFAQPVVESFGCSLWDVEYVRQGSERFLRLYIDKDGGIDIEDCEKIHRTIAPILDEATSALDSVTEAKIQRAFDNLAKGRTTLIIAHRLSTIRSAQRIVSIADGIITECGTHDELLQKGGIYADLYNTQNPN